MGDSRERTETLPGRCLARSPSAVNLRGLALRCLGSCGAIALAVALPAQQETEPRPPAQGLYHTDPEHLWNRLHRHLHVRTTPDGQEFGVDEVDPLLWRETRHLLTGPSHARALALLDEFLVTNADRFITDPVKRAVLQHDLWAIFDWAIDPSRPEIEGRYALSVRLARVMRRLALTRDQIEALPDTYRAAVGSGAASPPDLFDTATWIAVGGIEPIARQHAAERSRSSFSLHWSLPGGAGETLAYLRELWDAPQPYVLDEIFAHQNDGEARATVNPRLPPIPDRTRMALVRRMLLIDQTGAIVPSMLVESVQLRDFGGGQPFSESKLSRQRLFAGQAGGLVRVHAGDRSFITFSSHGSDVFESSEVAADRIRAQQRVTLDGCHSCHNRRPGPAIGSVLSIRRLLKPQALVDPRHERWWRWFTQPGVAATAKAKRYDWGVLRGVWQFAPP